MEGIKVIADITDVHILAPIEKRTLCNMQVFGELKNRIIRIENCENFQPNN